MTRKALGEIRNCISDLDCALFTGVYIAVPDIPRRKSLHGETGDDSEIVPSSFECLKQVRVSLLVGIDDAAVGENHFKIDDLIWING